MRLWENPKKEMIKELEFDSDGNPVTRVRIRLYIKKSAIENYVVQLEHLLDESWKQIIRFNYYHGFAHKDIYDKRGNLVQKIDLGQFNNLQDVVSLAINDINDKFKEYIDKFKIEERPK